MICGSETAPPRCKRGLGLCISVVTPYHYLSLVLTPFQLHPYIRWSKEQPAIAHAIQGLIERQVVNLLARRVIFCHRQSCHAMPCLVSPRLLTASSLSFLGWQLSDLITACHQAFYMDYAPYANAFRSVRNSSPRWLPPHPSCLPAPASTPTTSSRRGRRPWGATTTSPRTTMSSTPGQSPAYCLLSPVASSCPSA